MFSRTLLRAARPISRRPLSASAAPSAARLTVPLSFAFASAAATAGFVAAGASFALCDGPLPALPVYGAPGTNRERTFLAVKPDGVQRNLVGDIIARFEKR